MKNALVTVGISLALVIASGSLADNHILQDDSSDRESGLSPSDLSELTKRGLTYRFLDQNTIEVREHLSGLTRIKSLREPSETQIRAWADTQGLPILEIDPALIDTNQFSGWYTPSVTLPLSNSYVVPLVIGDLDRSGQVEIYGKYKDSTSQATAQIYEIDSNFIPRFRHDYQLIRTSRQIIDGDNDSLLEMMLNYGDSVYVYEQQSANSLPTSMSYTHAMWEYPGTAIFTLFKVTNLDGDGLIDFLYRGSELDSTRPNGFRYGTYVAEFDPSLNNFQRVWSTELWPDGEGAIGGYDYGDYDADGLMEFSASGLEGQVWVVENNADNSYGLSWQDTIPFRNVFFQTSGDVDNDGKRDLFIIASMSNGTWIIVFEAVRDNAFEAQFIMRILAGAFPESYSTADLDGDGRVELIAFIGSLLFRFDADADNNYRLGFFMHADGGDGIQPYDFNNDGRLDLLISGTQYTQTGLRFYAHVYLASKLVMVRDDVAVLPPGPRLDQNYPNPFNSSTVIRFSLPNVAHVRISIVTTLGEEVNQLINQEVPAGSHVVNWDGSRQSSGVYFCKMEVDGTTYANKMLLIR